MESIAEEYVGPAEVSRPAGAHTPTDAVMQVQVTLRGYFEPLDGRFHWYGRISPNDRIDDLDAGTIVSLTTPHGSADGRLSDLDPWGRFRISGTGRPPF